MADQVTELKTPNEDLTEEMMNVIRFEAYKCHMFLKKPSIHDQEDLINDGVVLFYKAHETYQEEIRCEPFIYYFWRTLKNEFKHKQMRAYYECGSVDLGDLSPWTLDFITPMQILQLKEKLGKLSPAAKEYVLFSLEPPEKIAREFGYRPRQRREITRQALHLSKWTERKIVHEIERIVD